MTVLPMFPLGNVLFPGAALSLHVFEPRYQALVRDCVAAADHEFGVVLIERGSEVGGGEVRCRAGTVARMVQVAEMQDGRFAVIAVGVRRIRVHSWIPDDPYPMADVSDWPDDDEVVSESEVRAVTQRVRRSAALATELGDQTGDLTVDIDDDPLVASYQLSDLAPVGPADSFDLLQATGAAARLTLLATLLGDVEAAQAFRLQRP